jgi:hypothetical protein
MVSQWALALCGLSSGTASASTNGECQDEHSHGECQCHVSSFLRFLPAVLAELFHLRVPPSRPMASLPSSQLRLTRCF